MNRRFYIIILAFAAICNGASAQQKQGRVHRPLPADYGMKKPTMIGRSKIRIKYAFQPKDIHDPETWIDCGQLLVGDGLTLYTSYFVAQNDSALRAWLKANPKKSYYPNRLCLHGRDYGKLVSCTGDRVGQRRGSKWRERTWRLPCGAEEDAPVVSACQRLQPASVGRSGDHSVE